MSRVHTRVAHLQRGARAIVHIAPEPNFEHPHFVVPPGAKMPFVKLAVLGFVCLCLEADRVERAWWL